MPRTIKGTDGIVLSERRLYQRIIYSLMLILYSSIAYYFFDIIGFYTLPGLVILVGLLIFKIFTDYSVIVRISKHNRTLSISRQSLVEHKFEIYQFDQIASLIYVDKTKGHGSYRLILPLQSGLQVDLSFLIGFGETQYFRTANLINEYVFDSPNQIPFKLTIQNR